MGIKFADVPDCLLAYSEVHSAGWAQILVYMAFCKVSQSRRNRAQRGVQVPALR